MPNIQTERDAQVDQETKRFRKYVYNQVIQTARSKWFSREDAAEIEDKLKQAKEELWELGYRYDFSVSSTFEKELIKKPDREYCTWAYFFARGYASQSWDEYAYLRRLEDRRKLWRDITVFNPLVWGYGYWFFCIIEAALVGNIVPFEIFYAFHFGMAMLAILFSPIVWWCIRQGRKRDELMLKCFCYESELQYRKFYAWREKVDERFDEFFAELIEKLDYRYPLEWKFDSRYFH